MASQEGNRPAALPLPVTRRAQGRSAGVLGVRPLARNAPLADLAALGRAGGPLGIATGQPSARPLAPREPSRCSGSLGARQLAPGCPSARGIRRHKVPSVDSGSSCPRLGGGGGRRRGPRPSLSNRLRSCLRFQAVLGTYSAVLDRKPRKWPPAAAESGPRRPGGRLLPLREGMRVRPEPQKMHRPGVPAGVRGRRSGGKGAGSGLVEARSPFSASTRLIMWTTAVCACSVATKETDYGQANPGTRIERSERA